MDKNVVRKAWRAFKFHARIVWRGFYRVLCGASITTLMVMSVGGFMMVSTESGWAAVADFILAAGLLALVGVCTYGMGKGGRHA